jgi:hypothetical protein
MTAIIDIGLFTNFLHKLGHGINNISKQWFIDNELVPNSICKCTIKRGINKGNPCFKRSKFNNGLCGRHYKPDNILINRFKAINMSTQTVNPDEDNQSIYSETSTLAENLEEILEKEIDQIIHKIVPACKLREKKQEEENNKIIFEDKIKTLTKNDIDYINTLQFLERAKDENIQDYMNRMENSVIRYADKIKKANIRNKVEHNIMDNINKDFNPNNVKFRTSPKRNMYINMMRKIVQIIPK